LLLYCVLFIVIGNYKRDKVGEMNKLLGRHKKDQRSDIGQGLSHEISREFSDISKEYFYASHHHLIPLYILSGVILSILVIGCYTAVLWQNAQREALRPLASLSVSAVEDLYAPAVVVPTEQKQYIYNAFIRFPVASSSNSGDTLRYNFDPGVAPSRTSSTISLSTTNVMQAYRTLVINNPEKAVHNITKLQECSRQYVIRFVPGLVPFGGYTSLADVKLKDGRTAYIHKNVNCVPATTNAMTSIDAVEKSLLAIESY
jgi:hypothetical protein